MSFFDDHHTCGCCGFHGTIAVLNELSLQQTERALRDYTGLHRVLRTESGDAPYVPGEVRLTELLGEHASSIADDIDGPIRDSLSTPYLDEARINASMIKAGAVWQEKHWPKGLSNEVREVLSATALIGQHDVPFGPALDDVHRLRVVNGMAASAKYYTNGYFNEHVMPAVMDAVHAAVLDGQGNDGAQIKAIHALLDRRLRSVPYWNLVANAAASRSYHYGYLQTGFAYGYRSVHLQAIVDERTSQICIDLNGTTWRVADVLDLAERIATAEGDDIKRVAPWLRPADVAGLTPQGLLDAGVCIPPLHGRCRSYLVFD